jgi:hypothetical protein
MHYFPSGQSYPWTDLYIHRNGWALTILTAAVYTPVGPAAAVSKIISVGHPLKKKSKIGRVSVCVCVFLKNGHLEMEVVDWWSNFLTAHVGFFNLGLKVGMKTDGIFLVPSRSVFYISLVVSVFARSRFRICGSRKWCFPFVSE